MRSFLAALTLAVLTLPTAGLTGCANALGGARQASRAAVPTVAWAGSAQAFEDETFETPTGSAAMPLRVELYQDGQTHDGAAGTLRFAGNADCAYRLTRAGTRTEDGTTIVNFDAEYVGTLDLASGPGQTVALMFCSHVSTRGRLITTLLDDGLLTAFIGEAANGGTTYYNGILPVAGN